MDRGVVTDSNIVDVRAEFLCQLSILAFYLRIFVSPKLRLATYSLMGLVTCFGVGNTFAMMLQCKPLSYFWDGWKGEVAGQCTVDVRLFGFIRGAIEILLDLAIITLPLPMLARLQMSLRKKLQIMSMFGVGFIITIVSCLRLWALVQFDQSSNPTCKYPKIRVQ
jgi:putative effector of murein hydrolase